MSKAKFLTTVISDGITAARKAFGSGVEKEIKKTAKGNKDLEAAKEKHKVKKQKESSATQSGVKFARNKDVKTGMPSEEELRIDAELRTARVAKGSQKPTVTVGKKSDPAKFEPTELLSKSTKQRMSKMVEIERKQRLGTSTKAEDNYLKAAIEKDKEALRTRNARISQALRGKKKAERTDYIDPETGEIFGKPTQNQVEAAARNARARGMTAQEREYRAFLEKEYGVTFYAGGLADKKYANLVTTNDRRKK